MGDSTEKIIARYEGERNRCWHSWFSCRGRIAPSVENTLIFDGGFRMAWESQEDRITALETALSDCVRHMKTAGSPEAVRAAEAAERLMGDA